MLRLLFSITWMIGNTGIAFCQSPANKATTQPSTRDNIKTNSPTTVNSNRDTIPLGKYKYYRVDGLSKLRYITEGINEDSIRMIKASKTDWAEFDQAYSDLKKTFFADKYKNVEGYIDTALDLVELAILNPSFFYNTAKVCLRQLTSNIQVLNQLLAKPLREGNDVQVLNMVMKNIDVLITKYIATKGSVYYILKTILPNVTIKVSDKAGLPLTNVKCYFISYKTCRDIACRTCVPALEPCEVTNIEAITNKADLIFDCNNPVSLKVNYGHYHLFVIGNNKIRHYEQLHIDENSISTLGTNEIKIIASK